MGKQIRISFRTTEAFKKRAHAAALKVGLDETVIEAAAIEAVIKHIEEFGEITIPVRLAEPEVKKTPPPSARPVGGRSVSRTEPHGLNEPEGDYPRRKPRKPSP